MKANANQSTLPFLFISHETRDTEIPVVFEELIDSVSSKALGLSYFARKQL